MGNLQDTEKNCFLCNKDVDGKYRMEFNLREDIVCFQCEKDNNTEIKVYSTIDVCQFCNNKERMTRHRTIKIKKSLCPTCYDYFYNTQEIRNVPEMIIGKNNMSKKFTRYGYVCTYCDILYNKLTSREIKTINYTHIPTVNGYARYDDKNTLRPTCYFCNHGGRYMRKCMVYSDKL